MPPNFLCLPILVAPRTFFIKTYNKNKNIAPLSLKTWLYTGLTPPGNWTTSGPLQAIPRQSFVGRSGHMADQSSWNLSIWRSGSTFRAVRISRLRSLSRSVTPWTLRKSSISAACTWDNIFHSIPNSHDHTQSWFSFPLGCTQQKTDREHA